LDQAKEQLMAQELREQQAAEERFRFFFIDFVSL